MADAKEVTLHALTGGPCGGKSTGRAKIVERLSDFGYSVLTPPEVATELFTNGVSIGGTGLSLKDFQRQALLMQLERENRYLEMARRFKNPKCIVLTDRGCCDNAAYLPPGKFEKLIREMGLKKMELLLRYKSVHHLVTAALGAPEFYTKKNNSARKETVEEAIVLDRRTLDSWVGANHVQVVDNSTGFDEKISRLLKGICSVLGTPIPLEIERKFIVKMPLFAHGFVVVPADIEQVELRSDKEGSHRIRKRGSDGYYAYYETRKKNIRKGVKHEDEHMIRPQDYAQLLKSEKDPDSDVVKKNPQLFFVERPILRARCARGADIFPSYPIA